MFRPLASRFLVAMLAFGVGCGSSGSGCSALKPLPMDPKPLGFPSNQLVEGGVQARITKNGMMKLSNAVPTLVNSALGGGLCAIKENDIVGSPGDSIHLVLCSQPSCPGGVKGCAAKIIFNSKDRPPPNNVDDGKDKTIITMPDNGTAPIVHVDVSFDVSVPVYADYGFLFGSGSCTLTMFDHHYKDQPTADPLHIVADIKLGIDPITGWLTLTLDKLDIVNLDLGSEGCGVLGSFFDQALGVASSTIGTFFVNLLASLLKPQINSFLQGLVPKPPGLAGSLDTASMLGKFSPPLDAALELYLVAGGYVASKAGGLTVGVLAGANSDRDPKTRGPGQTTEPNLCVPQRPAPDLAGAPWNLTFNPGRKDFTLMAAGPFSGSPDPVGPNGVQDVALGISRTFLDLTGFHTFNSGTLCLAVKGDTIPQLNAGTLAVVVGSLGDIIEDKKAPLALALRPQTPLTFKIGTGTTTDPLLNVAVKDLRVDFYVWLEERYARLMTVALDLNLGLNLTVTKTPDNKPALQPMLVGIDPQNITVRVANTDLLHEDPNDVAMVFPALLNIATSALGGVTNPIALPGLFGFDLSDLAVGRVQTPQDDFVSIFASLKPTATSSAQQDWSDPEHPRLVGDVRTIAAVEAVDTPSPAAIRAALGLGPIVSERAARPSVTLRLDADGAAGRPVEWAWRIDGGMWRLWTTDAHPVVTDDAFLLQGRHTIDVRARAVGDWSSEDPVPVHLDVRIDSVAPELHPARAGDRLVFGGFDLVSEPGALTYAWLDEAGHKTPFVSDDGLSIGRVFGITDDGNRPLVVFARDEAGNEGQVQIDAGALLGFHGRTTSSSSGCGCVVGGASGSAPLPLVAGLLVLGLLLRRRRLAALAGALGLSVVAAGCGCSDAGGSCRVDDDCRKMVCPAGQIPECQVNVCGCTPDQPPGDVGRFSSMTMIGQEAYVASYNTTYGDLMIGHVRPPGVVPAWEFVDGVPDQPPNLATSHVRGGITDKGDDVGRYTSIQANRDGVPIVAYYDRSHKQLKFASFGAVRWKSHVVDKGMAALEGEGDDVGRWASMSLGADGAPGIAYTVTARANTTSAKPEGQVRFAQATRPDPAGPGDWIITVVDTRILPDPNAAPPDGGVPPDMAGVDPPYELLPEGIGLMPASSRRSDGSPGIVYYDRTRGNLRFSEYRTTMGKWSTPIILDGEDAMGRDTADVGLYPSITYDDKDVAHVSYVDATRDNLLYVNTMAKMPTVVDDGYRPKDEKTLDGLDSPVFHLVGDSSSIQTQSGVVAIAYQDSTALQLRIAKRGPDGKWTHDMVAGHADPFAGSYGFYASLRIAGGGGVVSTYAIDQHRSVPAFYVELFTVDLGLIQ